MAQMPAWLAHRDASRRRGRLPIEGGKCTHFLRRELPGDNSHLFGNIVLARALGEGDQLHFDVVRLLPMKGRRSELVAAGAVAGGAWRDATLRITRKNEALRRI